MTQTSKDPLALEEQVCFAMVVAARSVLSVYRPLLEPMGLTHPQYLVMLALWQQESDSVKTLSVKDLSHRLQLDPGTLSPLLKRLEAAGHLTRQRAVEDERLLAVSLTDRGRALRAEALLIPPAVVRRLGMDDSQLRHLHESLTAAIAAVTTAAPATAVTSVTAVTPATGERA